MKQKKQEDQFLGAMMARSLIAPMASSLIQLAPSSLMNHIFRKGVMRVGKGQEGGILPFLAPILMLKPIAGKGVEIAGKEYNNMDYMDKNVYFCLIL